MSSSSSAPNKPKPTRPCYNCGSNDWWFRETFGPGEWLCNKCHPNPSKEINGQREQETEMAAGETTANT